MSLEYWLILSVRCLIITMGVTVGVVSGFVIMIYGFVLWRQRFNKGD